MPDFFVVYRRLLAFCCLLTGLIFSFSVRAGLYDILNNIYSTTSSSPNDEVEKVIVAVHDHVLMQGELSTRKVPVALYSPSDYQDLPQLQIEWSTDGYHWHHLADNSHFPEMKLDKQKSLEVRLPDIMSAPTIQWLVLRIRLLTPEQTTTHATIAVLPNIRAPTEKLKAIAFDIDGTIAIDSKVRKASPIPFQQITEELRDKANSGYLVFYVTSRCWSVNYYTRNWLRTHDLPPGIIAARSCELEFDKIEEQRKGAKVAALQEIMTYVHLEEFSGDSAEADILAAMQVQVPLIHWIVWGSQPSVVATMDHNKPESYEKQEPVERLSPPENSAERTAHRHSFRLCSVRLADDNDDPAAKLTCDYREGLQRTSRRAVMHQMPKIKALLQQELAGELPGTGAAAVQELKQL
ncbi:MAG: LNS2 domain-containing protein [Endozoicomonas sp.]